MKKDDYAYLKIENTFYFCITWMHTLVCLLWVFRFEWETFVVLC